MVAVATSGAEVVWEEAEEEAAVEEVGGCLQGLVTGTVPAATTCSLLGTTPADDVEHPSLEEVVAVAAWAVEDVRVEEARVKESLGIGIAQAVVIYSSLAMLHAGVVAHRSPGMVAALAVVDSEAVATEVVP